MTTPEQYGMIRPTGNDLISEGDNAITQNATATALALDSLTESQYVKRPLLTTDVLFTLPSGLYSVASGTVATALGLPAARLGSVNVNMASTIASGVKTITFTTNHLNDDFPLQVWQIASDNSGSFAASTWREMTDRNMRGIPPLADIDQWFHPKYNGVWAISPGNVTTAGSTNPTPYAYHLWSYTLKNGQTSQLALSNHVNDTNMYYRAETATGSKVFVPWKRMATSDEIGQGTLTIRHELAVQDMAAYRGGKVDTKGAAPVALIWDDFPADFRDKVLPLLRARKLPATLAIGSRILTEPYKTSLGGGNVTWAQIDSWTLSDGIEVANHGATHGDRLTRADMEDEIVTGLAELKTKISTPVYCWVQPSVAYDAGFDNGLTRESYADTYAGNLILEHHAMATGTREPNGELSCPRRGQPMQGMRRIWIDQTTANAKTIIGSLQAKGHGVLVGSHANRYGTTGNTTIAQLTTFLDWLKAEQDAGRIKVMTLSEWAVADTGPR